MGRNQVLLISRFSTQNAGNEALSKEMIHFFSTSLPEADVRGLDRYPRYFETFTLDKLGSDPIKTFEDNVDRLIADFARRQAQPASIASEDLVRIDARGTELKGPLRRLKRRIALRKRLAIRGLIERDQVATAVRACAQSDLVIWNPAGEIHPVAHGLDHVYRLLLMLGVAHRQGRHTAVINHSLEIEDDRLRRLVAHVYRKLSYVGLRDAQSIEVARALGVSEAKLFESPDLVFLTMRRPGGASIPEVEQGSIALAINGLEAMQGSDEWQTLMSGLEALGRPILLVSNAVNHDRDFALQLSRMASRVKVIMHQPGYQDLRRYYRPCSVLISSRLHASILALSEGVPVVSIEPSLFKLTAIFEQMGYPIATERLQVAGWAEKILANVRRCLSSEADALRSRGVEIVREQDARIEAGYAPLLALARD